MESKNTELDMERKGHYANSSQGRSATDSETRKPKTYGHVFSKFADMTSMQGVGYIKNSKLTSAKLIWSFLLLVSLAALTVHLWSSLKQFYSYPKTAKINLGFANLQFPDITICNINPVSKRRLDAYNSTNVEALKRLIDALEPQKLVPEQFNETLSFSDIADLYSDGGTPDYYDNFWDEFGSDDFYDNYDLFDFYEGIYGTGDDDLLTEENGGYEESGPNEGDLFSETDEGGSGEVPDEGMMGSEEFNMESDYIDNEGIFGGGMFDMQTEDGESESSEEGENTGQVKKKRKKRYAEMLDNFNFTDFDPTFEDWFRHDKKALLSEDEYGAAVDTSTKVQALFRKTFMSLARWERGRLGHNITKMLLKCTFAGRVCDDNKRLFRLHQTSEYGNCWTLSSPKFLAQDAGPNAGLSLVLNLQSTDYLKGITHGYGARIQIHNRGAYPDPFQDGISIPASMETNIGLKLVSFERLSGNYGDCEDGEEFRKRYKRPYTRRTCQIFCHATKIMDTCGCFDEHSEEVAVKTGQGANLTACQTLEQYNCVHRVKEDFEQKTVLCSCRNPCRESAYTKSITNNQWPTDEHSKLLLAGICADDHGACKAFLDENNTIFAVYNNFLKLNIYYEDLNFEEIKEEPDIGTAQILSDVGGAVGLWIGLSVISFCELIQLGVELIRMTRDKIRGSQSRSQNNPRKRKADEKWPSKHIPYHRGFNSIFGFREAKHKRLESFSSRSKSGSNNRDDNMFSLRNRAFLYGHGPHSDDPTFGSKDRHRDFEHAGHAHHKHRDLEHGGHAHHMKKSRF